MQTVRFRRINLIERERLGLRIEANQAAADKAARPQDARRIPIFNNRPQRIVRRNALQIIRVVRVMFEAFARFRIEQAERAAPRRNPKPAETVLEHVRHEIVPNAHRIIWIVPIMNKRISRRIVAIQPGVKRADPQPPLLINIHRHDKIAAQALFVERVRRIRAKTQGERIVPIEAGNALNPD